jgi:DNA-binding beta-propeller fold protein YncE
MIHRCATTGCHNEKSSYAAGGLELTSWDKLFEGTVDNAAVVPYRSDQSFLSFFINTYNDLGPVLLPTMPYNKEVLTREEVELITGWINQGAPNDEGEIMFSDDPNRKKFYVCNQGCDLVTVFDVETGLIMRYIDVGASAGIESPHMVEVTPDGSKWVVCFYAGNILQVFNTEDDQMIGEINIGNGSWNTFAISPDSKYAFVINLDVSGSIEVVNLETMEKEVGGSMGGSGFFTWPHGSAMDSSGNTLYVTAQEGNFINKIDVADIDNPGFEKVVLATGELPMNFSSYKPHEIYFSPDYSHYFVTCQGTNEIRVFTPHNDSLVAIIPVGKYPQEMSFSESRDYAFVSCTGDDITFPGTFGSVSVIDYNNFISLKQINTGYQPHGIAVDDYKQQVYVINRNASQNGPAPHHTTDCGGRNGYVTIIDMNTLELVPGYKAELSVDPYYVTIRK